MNHIKTSAIFILATVILYVYNVFYYNYAINILGERINKKIILSIFPILTTIFVIILIRMRMYFPLSNIITFFFYVVVFLYIFKDSFYNILILCGNNLFHVLYVRHFTIVVISLYFKTSEYDIVSSIDLALLSLGITRAIMLVMGLILVKTYGYARISILLKNKNAIKYIFLILASLLLVMINSYYINYDLLSGAMRKLAIIFNGVCITAGYYFLFIIAIKCTRWIEKEKIYEVTYTKLDYQRKLYDKQQQYQKNLKIYNHDYKDIIANALFYLDRNDIEGGKRILYQMQTKLNQLSSEIKRYSNHLLVDSILCSLADKCAEAGIKFSANCYIPDNITIPEIELGRILNNVKSNSYEACKRQAPGEERYIIFKSFVKHNSLVIYERNSFDGNAVISNGQLVTSKTDKNIHGIGVESIRQTVESLDGMVLVKAENEKKEFEILIKLPLET